MEQHIKELMNEHILEDAAKFFGIDLSDLKYIGGFQNFVYEYPKKDKLYILRITHSSHRHSNHVCGEIEWVQYLYNNGVSVSKPIASKADRYVEVLELDNSYFIITSFEKAPGKKIFYPECMNNDPLSEMCGELTGQIHKLSRTYVPSRKEFMRHDWTENSYLKDIKKYIPSNQDRVFESFKQLTSQINNLKKEDKYGLIHGDINVGNFFIDHNKMTLFDFDECQYSWYVEDIAIQIFYMVYVVLNDSIPERNKQARKFLKCFLKGYERYRNIDDESLNNLSLFLRLREFIVYIGMYRSFDLSKLIGLVLTLLRAKKDWKKECP
ncbi:phosphotransferase enzyme family protein [Paenibacillus sp. FSL R5-0810]|uniref:phosphotransferase enzyme family protein n=1 Tax=Paenibacillus sp. FSL R5-0810 TaxID=2921659 RepID=UPI0030F8CE06